MFSEPHASQVFNMVDTVQKDSDDLMDVYTEPKATRNPLSKLEEMKKQLPAVTERLSGPKFYLFDHYLTF